MHSLHVSLTSVSFLATRGPWFVAVALACLATTARAQSVKLNDPLARAFVGEIDDVQISPDGQWTVHRANPDSLSVTGIFSVPTKGGEPILLADDVPTFVRFQISPDSQFVLYSNEDLFLVPIDGSREPAVIAEGVGRDFLHTPDGTELVFESGGEILRMPAQGGAEPILVAATGSANDVFAISPDGNWVLFLGNTNTVTELWAAALDGSTGPIRLSGDLVGGGDVRWFTIAPDSLHVVYVADQDTDRVLELYGTRIDGSVVPAKLNGPLTQQRALSPWGAWISPDSTRAVYQADQDRDDVVELFSAPIEGGAAPVRLNDVLPAHGDVITSQGTIHGVVYLADQGADGVFELFHVGPARTQAPRKISQALPPGFSAGAFEVSADGRVVYTVNGPSTGDLYSVQILGNGPPIRLTALTGGERVGEFEITADSQRVVYRSSPGHQLFSVRTDGVGAPLRLDDGGNVQVHTFLDPLGERVLYTANRDRPEVYELFSVPTDASEPPVKLNRPMDDGLVVGDVTSSVFGPDGTWALFVVQIADGNDDPPEELYSVRLQPLSRPTLLFSGYIGSTSFSPDGTRAIFRTVSPGGEGDPALYSVPLEGHVEPVQLNDSTDINFGVGAHVFSPDGDEVIYSQDGGAAGIYRVPIDGSAPAVELTGWTGFVDRSYLFDLDASGSFIVLLAEELVPDEFELFRLGIDGGAPPVPINDLVNPRGSRRYGFQISEDGSRVIYAVDGVTDEVFELFSAPVAGGAGPTKLSGTLAPGSDVDGFALVPGSDRVVFRVRDSIWNNQLFSAPILGGADPVRLHPVPTPGGGVKEFRIGSDGLVAFTADQTTDERVELFVVPSDGSADPTRLDSNVLAQGDVFQFEFSPDGQRVVYRADHAQDEVFDVFSAPVDGRGPVQLSGGHVPGGDVRGFQITPDGQRVVFEADHAHDEVFELYSAPIDRIKSARRISGPLVEDGDVLTFSFRLSPDGQKAMYIADQDEDGVFELYLTPVGPSLRATRPNGTHAQPGGAVVR